MNQTDSPKCEMKFTPRFIMLYNGGENQPEHSIERLSDAFVEKLEHPPLELEVEVFNISRNCVHVPELLKRCKSLGDYSTLIEFVEGYRKQGLEIGEAIRLALQDCLKQGVMQEYLEAHGAEVHNMIFTEWNWDDAFRVRGEEEYAAGLEDGERNERLVSIRNLMETMQLSLEQAMEALKIPTAEQEQYRKLLQAQEQ